MINELAAAVPKSLTKRTYNHEENDAELEKAIVDGTFQKYYDITLQASAKEVRGEAFAKVKEDFVATLTDEQKAKKAMLARYFKKAQKSGVRRAMLEKGIRLDGRKMDEIRPIWSEVDVLPGTHGSAIFTRGETQAINMVTLGSKMDQQTVDTALVKRSDTFMLHYNFPSFSVGEVRPIRGPGRREIGHGNLALRALSLIHISEPTRPY